MVLFKKINIIGCLFGALVLTGCNQTLSIDECLSETSAVLFKISAVPNTPFAKLAKKASLTIIASDMNSITRTLTITATGIEGTVTGIPSGRGRLFSVAVYDSLDSLQYIGSATSDLPRGATVNVPINIKRVTTNAIINGSIIENDTDLTISNGLVAYYPFNGSARDLSGNFNDGAVHGAVLTTNRKATLASAYLFDGVDDYIEIPYDSTLDCEDKISITVWAKSDISGDQYIEDGILIQMGSGSEEAYGMWVGKYVDVMQFVFRCHQSPSALTLADLNAATIDGAVRNSFIVDTAWHFYAMVFNGEMMYAFIDNVNVGSKVAVPGSITNGNPLIIGAQSKDVCRFWKGKIDAVRIYHRALSKEEVVSLSKLDD